MHFSSRGPHRWRGVAVAAAAVMLVAVGCRTTVGVDIEVADSGAGVVTVTAELDPDALVALGGADRVLLEDLADGGWEVDPPAEDGGGVTYRASKAFVDGAELAEVLDEVGGVDGVFRDTSLQLTDGFGTTDYDLDTTVSVTGDPQQFTDEALTALLGGVPLGWTEEELVAAGALTPGAAELVVTADLPGDPPEELARVDLTSGTPTEERLTARSTVTQPAVRELLVGGAALVLVSLVLLLVGLRRRHRSGNRDAGGGQIRTS